MGRRNSPEYLAWRDMKRRCLNPLDKDWNRYGGRGIRVSERWVNSFRQFLADVGAKPEPTRAYSLGRIDNDGHYERGNVEWQLRADQMNNKANNRLLEIAGEKMTLAEASRRFGRSKQTMFYRLSTGMCAEKAATVQPRPLSNHQIGAITANKLLPEQIPSIRKQIASGRDCKSIAADAGVSPASVRRIKKGISWRNH